LSINAAEARAIAERYLVDQRNEHDTVDVVIVEDWTQEEPMGWVFHYNTPAFVASHDVMDSLIGYGPIVVDRQGKVHETGTLLPLEEYLAELRNKLAPS
jgi:hypothetical protein